MFLVGFIRSAPAELSTIKDKVTFYLSVKKITPLKGLFRVFRTAPLGLFIALYFGFANALNVSFQIPTSDIQRSEHGHGKGYGKEFGIN